MARGWATPKYRLERVARLIAASRRPRRQGRIERQICRRFWGEEANAVLTTSQLIECCTRNGKRPHDFSVRRAAERICIRVGYANTRGGPVLWRLRPELQGPDWRQFYRETPPSASSLSS
jgi:hypothetical protein